MPTIVTNYFKLEEGGQNVSLSGDPWMCSLMDEYVNSASNSTLAAHTIMSAADISAHEVTGTGYAASALSNVGWYDDPNTQRLSADSVTFSTVSVSSYGCTIWRETDGLIMGFIDFGSEQVSSNADFVINWNSDGILNKI